MFQNTFWSNLKFGTQDTLQNVKKEPFVASESDLRGRRQIATYFSETQPFGVFTSRDANLNLGELTGTYISDNEKLNVTPFNAPANSEQANTGALFQNKDKECAAANGGTSFQRLSQLNNTQSKTDKFRCGWIYDNNNPEGGVGAFGSRDGPILSKQPGQWYWNLADAKQKFHTAICKEVKNCGDLSSERYSNICGYCRTSQSAVPISGGRTAYPYTSPCVTSALVTSADKCPRPQTRPNPSAFQNSQMPAVNLGKALNACDPFENGRLPAACLVSKALQTNCLENGSLITSLNTGSDRNYFETLENVPAYKEYQRRTDNSINDMALKQGRATIDVLLSQFGSIERNTRSSNLGLQAAARDLCFEKGSFETFDFCTEIKDSDYTPSVSLTCIQREFLRHGGQRTGTLYPTRRNLSFWKQFTPWSKLKDKLKELKAKSMSVTEGFTAAVSSTARSAAQIEAATALQGIPLTAPRNLLDRKPGVEHFIFSKDDDIKRPDMGVFLGRILVLGGEKPAATPGFQYNNFHNWSLRNTPERAVFSIADIRFNKVKKYNILFQGNAGFMLTKNKPLNSIYQGGGSAVKDSELSSLYTTFNGIADMSTTQQGAGGSWTFYDTTPNVLIAYSPGGSFCDIRFELDSGFPRECGCFGTTTNGLRMYNKGECDAMNGNFYPNGECIIKTGGSYSWNCRNLPTPCESGWRRWAGIFQWDNEAFESKCFLTQHPDAPMISFNVEQDYDKKYNSPYLFCDRRIGSHKMTWSSYVSPPTWVFRGTSRDTDTFPLGLNYASMVGGGMFSNFSLKRNSFDTMVFIMRFVKLPGEGKTGDILMFWPTDWNFGAPSLFVETQGGKTFIKLNSGLTRNEGGRQVPEITMNNPVVELDQTYIITIDRLFSPDIRTNVDSTSNLERVIERSGRGIDPNTGFQNARQVTGMRVSANLLSSLIYRDSLSIPNISQDLFPRNIDNVNSPINDRLLIPPSPNCHYHLFSIQLFDYVVNGHHLKNIATNSWPVLDGAFFNT